MENSIRRKYLQKSNKYSLNKDLTRDDNSRNEINNKSPNNNNKKIEILNLTNYRNNRTNILNNTYSMSPTILNNKNRNHILNINNNNINNKNHILNLKDNNKSKILTESNIEESKINNNTHEDNLKTIELLKKQLNDIEKENRLLSKEINLLKNTEKSQIREYNKINNDINKQKTELIKLKDINITKTQKYLELRNVHREIMIRNIRSIHRDTVNELNRQSLHRFFDRLAFLYRMRRENNANGNPSMTDEQIQALPISYYPRNDNSDEKCIICSFPFCYNDVIIKLRTCNHIFHKACLINTLTMSRSSICPICRVSII